MKKSICLIIIFCFLFSVSAISVPVTASNEIEENEWPYEFEEFDDDYLVLSPERQQAYILDALNASYSSNVTCYDNYMEIYYDNLTQNFGKNYKGSCGYVAIGMLLSYYDTFLNDNIIPEQYDVMGEGVGIDLITWRDSPGVLRDIIDNGYNLSAGDYYDAMLAQSEYSLHAKLITIGHRFGYYNYLSNMPAGTTFGMVMAVLKGYLNLYREYTNNDYSLNYAYELIPSEDNSVRDFVINEIQEGKPVLLALYGFDENNKKEGHVVIAYDYNESTDEIYCHFGWGADKTHITPESEGLTLYKAALTVDFDLNNTHSYNYNEYNSDNMYCSCYFSCHPEHECRYYLEYDGTYHTYACDCNASEETLLEHNFVTQEQDKSRHTLCCVDCGYVKTEFHNYQYIEHDDEYHNSVCKICGYSENNYHFFKSYNTCYEKCLYCQYSRRAVEHDYTSKFECKDNINHYGYCACGSVKLLEHNFYETDKSKICYDCGYNIELNHVHSYTYTPNSNGRSHRKICRCGINVLEACKGMISVDGDSYCMTCGQKMNTIPELLAIDENGEVIPLVKKEEDYSCD